MPEFFPGDEVEFDVLYIKDGALTYTGKGTVSHLNTGKEGEIAINVKEYTYANGKKCSFNKPGITNVKLERVRKLKSPATKLCAVCDQPCSEIATDGECVHEDCDDSCGTGAPPLTDSLHLDGF